MDPRNPSGAPPWSADVLEHPRLSRLLRDADEARALLTRSGKANPDVQLALDSLHRDLGRALHELVRPPESIEFAPPLVGAASFGEDGGTVFPTQTASPPLAATTADPLYDDDWYTDEAQPGDAPLFGDGDLVDEHTDVPESDPFLTLKNVVTAEPTAREILTLEPLLDDAVDPAGELHQLRLEDAPPWRADLDQLLELVAPPRDLVDPGALPEEVSKVQWAAGEAERRLARVPERVQAAAIAMLAARARNLQGHLDLDLGPRLALDRLRAWREKAGLPWVRGLVASMGPESDSWADDAISYWELLRPSDRG